MIEEDRYNLSYAGMQILQIKLQKNFWILSARKKIRSVISKSQRCKRYRVKRMEAASAPLPIERVRDCSVFAVVDADLAGQLYLKSKEKAWVCLYTCVVYQGVHLELLTSLSTDTFIKGLRRFISRRGRSKFKFSDNGTNFVGAENLVKMLDWEKISNYSSAK